MLKKQLKRDIQQSILAKKSLIKISSQINESIKILTECLKNGNKILICGNGGSAADAQHLAAEFLVRLRPNVNRKSLPVISLALDTSTLTACGNDYSFDKIFSRSLSAIGSENDVLDRYYKTAKKFSSRYNQSSQYCDRCKHLFCTSYF